MGPDALLHLDLHTARVARIERHAAHRHVATPDQESVAGGSALRRSLRRLAGRPALHHAVVVAPTRR